MALKSRLPEIASNLDPAVAAAVAEAAEVVAAKARVLVPKHTTDLEQAIHTDQEIEYYHGKRRLTTWVVAWSHDAFYGHFVEYGTFHLPDDVKRKHEFGATREHVAAHPASAMWSTAPRPFMVPALEASRTEGRDIIKKGIQAACEGQGQGKFRARTKVRAR